MNIYQAKNIWWCAAKDRIEFELDESDLFEIIQRLLEEYRCNKYENKFKFSIDCNIIKKD